MEKNISKISFVAGGEGELLSATPVMTIRV